MGGVGVVGASACAALTWAGLAAGVAGLVAGGPAVPGAGQAEGTCAALAVMPCAGHVEACGVPAVAASVDQAAASVGPVDELGFAVEAGSVVADAVLEDTAVLGKAACGGRYQSVLRVSEPCSCPPAHPEVCSPPVLDHHLQQQLPRRRLRQQRPLCEAYHAVDRCRSVSWLLMASSALAGAKVGLLQRPTRSGPPCGDDHASAS